MQLLAAQISHAQVAERSAQSTDSASFFGNRIFIRIPTANIEALVNRFEPVPVQAGETIMEQGDPATTTSSSAAGPAES